MRDGENDDLTRGDFADDVSDDFHKTGIHFHFINLQKRIFIPFVRPNGRSKIATHLSRRMSNLFIKKHLKTHRKRNKIILYYL